MRFAQLVVYFEFSECFSTCFAHKKKDSCNCHRKYRVKGSDGSKKCCQCNKVQEKIKCNKNIYLFTKLWLLTTKPILEQTAVLMGDTLCSSNKLDMEYWMTDLPPQLKDEPIIYLAIPGSHDSMSYGINQASELAPDAPQALKRLFPLFRGTIMRWTRTQDADTTHQLILGIRYFDLRLATKKDTDRFFFTHGLYAQEISGALTEIKEFLQSHPQEVVILDFQHFYGFSQDDHVRLIAALISHFGPILCPRAVNLESITLNTMYKAGQQIIIVYRNPKVYMSLRLWRPELLPSPWPRKDSTRGLINFLTDIRRHAGTGFVHQAVLTPTSQFIILRWMSSIRQQCAVPVQEKVFPLLSELRPGSPRLYRDNSKAPVNVVIADFIEMNQAQFSRTIVALNYKLLDMPHSNVYRG